MRRAAFFGLILATATAGCAAKPPAQSPQSNVVNPVISIGGQTTTGGDVGVASDTGDKGRTSDAPISAKSGEWIGAAPESELVMRGAEDGFLGVWVDIPEGRATTRAPMDVALVVDTSGSMAGEKIENARKAARQVVQSLQDGDIVSLDTFSDEARMVFAPQPLNEESRAHVLHEIATLGTGGSTNMFAGLSLAEAHIQSAPQTHTVRRVVMISDGMANVGPSSPAVLGTLAERGLRADAQVTSLGVGIDYDENTLNALAVRTSGRLYHLGDPREMPRVLSHEMDLLSNTVASAAFIEVVPAPGVMLVSADTVRADRGENGSLRIPLGALHGGQHREALVRVRYQGATMDVGSTKPIASVRLRFHDPADGGIERVQEVVARATVTDDAGLAARSGNARTQAIMALQDAAKAQIAVAQTMNNGDFTSADRELERAEKKLEAQAAATKDVAQQRRLADAAGSISAARATTAHAAAAPKAVQRNDALEMNKAGMSGMGF